MLSSHASFVVMLALACGIITPLYLASWTHAFVVVKPNEPKFAKVQLWFLLVAVQGAVWGLCASFLFAAFRKVWEMHGDGKVLSLFWAFVPTVMLAAALRLYAWAAGSDVRPDKLGGITLNHSVSFATFGVAIAMAAVAGMFLVRRALLSRTGLAAADIGTYLALQSQFQVFLFVAATISSLGTLGFAAMRTAVNAEKGTNYFPAEYVVVYGVVFTLLLLIAYVPVKTAFWDVGKALVNQLMQSPPASGPDVAKWLQDKSEIEKALDLDLTTATALLGPIATALPLLSSWIAILLGGSSKP